MTTHTTMFAGVHASSVGTGIANAIFAVADSLQSPESWVHFCITAAEEAHAAVLQNPPLALDDRGEGERLIDEVLSHRTGEAYRPEPITGSALLAAANAAAATAFRCCMPKVTGRRNTQAYIACIAAGVARGYIAGKDARPLLYTAQLALQAHPKTQRTPRPQRKKAGFAQ